MSANYFAAQNECTQDALRWIVEASQLNIPPGRIVRVIETDIGNANPFVWTHTDDCGIQQYRQHCGIYTLAVLND